MATPHTTHKGVSFATRRTASVIIALGLLGLGAWLRASGALWDAYRWAYVALAYPVAWTLDFLARLRQGLHGGHLKSTGLDWSAWVGHAAARYPALQGKPYHTLVVIEAGALAVLAAAMLWRVGWFVLTRVGTVEPGTTHGDAHLATRRELRVLRDRGGPLLLGRQGRWGRRKCLPPAWEVLNTLVIGVPGSGKTAGVIAPNLLRERGGARGRGIVATDLKRELLRLCGPVLRRTHDVIALDFIDPDGPGYNPLTGCTSPLDTFAFCEAWVSNTGTSRGEPFWDSACKEIMAAAIFHLQATLPMTPTLGDLYAFLCAQAPDAIIAVLEVSPAPLARESALSFMGALKANEKLLGGAFAEIKPRFRIMSDPRVQAVTGHHDVEVARLADPTCRPVALFLTLDRTLQEELKPLSAAFFLDLFKTLSQLADASPTGELGRSVTIYGDELANIGAIPKMAVWISTLRSAGVAMLLVVQATAQLVALYGEEGAATIMGSCATKIGMSGMGPEDTRLFSDLAGKTTRVSAQASKQRGRFAVVSSGGGRSQAETAADLLTADQVRRLDPDELLAVVRYLPVARLRQCRWYRDRRLRRRVARARAQEAA